MTNEEESLKIKEAICNTLNEREGEKELLAYIFQRYHGLPLGFEKVIKAVKEMDDKALNKKIEDMKLKEYIGVHLE